MRAFDWPAHTSSKFTSSPIPEVIDRNQHHYHALYNQYELDQDKDQQQQHHHQYQNSDDYEVLTPSRFATSASSIYRDMSRHLTEWPPSKSRFDYFIPQENKFYSTKHHHEHEIEHKEVGLAYPVLLALLLLGALFIPFLSLFFFLAVSAFNCHGIGGPLGATSGIGSGFQPVAPVFGRRRRRKRDLELELINLARNGNKNRNGTELWTRNLELLKQQANYFNDDEYGEIQRENLNDTATSDSAFNEMKFVDLDWHDRIETNWDRLLHAVLNWLEPTSISN